MNIKKVPVEYCFSNLVHDPSQRGSLKMQWNLLLEELVFEFEKSSSRLLF